MVACIQGSLVKNAFKFQEYSILASTVTDPHNDLVTAQVDHPIILESTLNDSALYLRPF